MLTFVLTLFLVFFPFIFQTTEEQPGPSGVQPPPMPQPGPSDVQPPPMPQPGPSGVQPPSQSAEVSQVFIIYCKSLSIYLDVES